MFVVPARRMGTRLARLEREAANHNATMATQMTERFSAPGATLIKLFGRPEDESAEFAERAGRVRTIGVRTAMVQSVFVTALTLVSALALAVVYGLGGQHNDALMLLCALGAVALVVRGRALGSPLWDVGAGAAIVAGVAFKFSLLGLVPLVVLGARRRPAALAGAVGTSLSFGGGEEGGWHYDDCELVTEPHVYARLGALPAAFVTWEEAEKHAAEMEKGLAEINQGRPPKHSILSQGVYEVLVLEAAVAGMSAHVVVTVEAGCLLVGKHPAALRESRNPLRLPRQSPRNE